MSDAEYLTVEEAAEFCRCPIATFYGWRVKGIGPPAYKVGRRVLVRRDELIAWIESQPS